MCVCVFVWSVITGSWPFMLTQTFLADWPFEINKHTSDPLCPQAAEFFVRLKIRNPERSMASNPNRNTCDSPHSALPGAVTTSCGACKQFTEREGRVGEISQMPDGSSTDSREAAADPKHRLWNKRMAEVKSVRVRRESIREMKTWVTKT